MARANKPTGPKPVDSLRHQDKRANIPTNELRGFVEGDESAPAAMLYPRDPSLDPQLVWKGKDEQDRQPLEVPVVPIYIQEKILPQAIIENLRDTARKGEPEPEMTLFNDYDGIEFQELVEFYRHEQNWANRMILGDSLLVMTSLAEKEGLKGKVQMIYMDPPYGIKFGSNWQVSTRKRDVKDGKAEDATRQPEQIKAFRDTWELGIHSYLAYLRDRLVVSRELLSETGSIFVQIGDENVHLVRAVMDEVFGSENFVSSINFRTMNPLESGHIESVYDHLVWYARTADQVKYRNLWRPKGAGASSEFVYVDDRTGRPDAFRTTSSNRRLDWYTSGPISSHRATHPRASSRLSLVGKPTCREAEKAGGRTKKVSNAWRPPTDSSRWAGSSTSSSACPTSAFNPLRTLGPTPRRASAKGRCMSSKPLLAS